MGFNLAFKGLKKFYIVISFNMCVLYGSRKTEKILPNTVLKDWVFNRGGECLLRGTHSVCI